MLYDQLIEQMSRNYVSFSAEKPTMQREYGMPQSEYQACSGCYAKELCVRIVVKSAVRKMMGEEMNAVTVNVETGPKPAAAGQGRLVIKLALLLSLITLGAALLLRQFLPNPELERTVDTRAGQEMRVGKSKKSKKDEKDAKDVKDGSDCDDETYSAQGFAFKLENVEYVLKPDEKPVAPCYYPVTVPGLIDLGLTNYAWIPWSYLTKETLQSFPHGLFIYQQGNADPFPSNGPHILLNITPVPVDSQEANLMFGPGFKLDLPYNTFDEAMISQDHSSLAVYTKEAIACTRSPLSFSKREPFVNYRLFSWMGEQSAGKCGSFIYELKNGCGIVAHDC
eukprot:g66448.t1